MSTIKQKRAFDEIGVNGGNISKAMKVAGYSPSASKRTDKLTRTKGWKELMEQHFPDSLLAKKHKELLNKKEVVVTHSGKETKIELTEQPHSDAKQALDMAYKLKRKYPQETEGGNKTLVLIVSGETAQRYGHRINSISKDSSS